MPVHLNIAVKELKSSFAAYKAEYKQVSLNKSREKRDKIFNELLEKLELDSSLSNVFKEICAFYLKQSNTGFLGSEPGLIKFMRQAFYPIFGIPHALPNSRRTYSFASYDLTPETDLEIMQVNKAVSKYCHSDSIEMKSSSSVYLAPAKSVPHFFPQAAGKSDPVTPSTNLASPSV